MPSTLWDLFTNETSSIAKHFRKRSRTYNNTTAFTSLGIQADSSLCSANKGVYTLKVHGVIYHYIKDLVPGDGNGSHVQLYFYGTENELSNRLAQSGDLNETVLLLILEVMKLNPYANFFRQLRDVSGLNEYSIVLRADPNLDQRVYNLPIVDHVAAIWKEPTQDSDCRPHDIRVYTESGCSYRINYYYGCYDPLQYPLLFPYGEPGWHRGIQKLTIDGPSKKRQRERLLCSGQNIVAPTLHASGPSLLAEEEETLNRRTKKRMNVAAREFYCYMFQIRSKHPRSVLRTGRLAQQFIIDMYIKIECQRLDFLRDEQRQHQMRMESYQGIVDSVACDANAEAHSVGKRTYLPSSFIGSPRDMRKRYLNAMALVQEYGKPDFFITMTCNPNWPEIQNELLPGEEAHNRPDLVARVFRAKNEELKDELLNRKLFGEVAAYVYVIEFQKRGMPHAHWLLIMKKRFQLTSVEAYDRFVSAEIPCMKTSPYLHSCVMRHNMHGPCGEYNPTNVCMRDGKCKNKFPRAFVDVTSHRSDAYPLYRRRDDGRKVFVRRQWLDNRWVVPYNPYLTAKFDCHINVEICSNIKLIKYLYKYVCKGTDRVAYSVVEHGGGNNVDEIADYQTARWICAPEAIWRIYGFSLNEIHPTVLQLHVHLPNQNYVWFTATRLMKNVISNPNASKTQLTEFFYMNQHDAEANSLNLLYKDFPRYFVWSEKDKKWSRRKSGIAIGRMVTVSPIEGERYYLRILLSHVRAPRSFEHLRTFNGVLYASFREAALARGLLESDNDIHESIREACTFQMPYVLRRFFATILIYNSPSNPKSLWDEFKDEMSHDFGRDVCLPNNQTYRRTLQSVDIFLQSMGRSVDEFNLVEYKLATTVEEIGGRDFDMESSIIVSDADLIAVAKLNSDQKLAFDAVMSAMHVGSGGCFFVDGPGGTGKTFLYRALLATIRSKGGIALAVASSGVAASLLPGGRTAHSRFKLPLIVEESLTCSVSKQSVYAKLIMSAKLIIWDEAAMVHRKSIEAFDKLLRDLCDSAVIFGGKTVVFGGDFRQTVPIVVGGTREDAVAASFSQSHLWPKIRKLKLRENMRAKDDPDFTEFLLRVGSGAQPYVGENYINLPPQMCIPFVNDEESVGHLVADIYPSFEDFAENPYSVMDRAILAPKNNYVDDINEVLIDRFPGDMVEYVSRDLTNDPLQQAQYQDFLNGIKIAGLPPHLLRLKRNSPIMLLRNINPSEGLCNGTRLICKSLGKNVIGAVIASGEHIGRQVFIPRIPLEPSDKVKCPIPFKRHQFPIRLCFAMTINKAQGQTLERVGIYLPEPVFSHGQLYVALSRVRKANAVKVLIRPPTADSIPTCLTKNIVYHEVLSDS